MTQITENYISFETAKLLKKKGFEESTPVNTNGNSRALLLKDLCSRLPYGVICHTPKGNGHLCSINRTIFGTKYGVNINPLKRDYFNDSDTEKQTVRPYLRPISSMTAEEKEDFGVPFTSEGLVTLDDTVECMDWLNKHHFDYRGLIPMGLALEAPEDMYKKVDHEH